ncbi:unnamed protein product [Acanthoscelides obtectus]|uniref:Uncharacterized protein n=1 Tax=Acanthoscelides obtectus TaxID=200917 RepID=A0A9P0L3F0_ACAOB|nr:unnamed protein product [Acanthoscelides obtectus]CAK1677710.1 hypothetical protein AOBTE_LOCUS31500 [Acanthoscelides obtectus]
MGLFHCVRGLRGSANLVAERLVDEAGKFLGTLTKEIALPETGLFAKPISCILDYKRERS